MKQATFIIDKNTNTSTNNTQTPNNQPNITTQTIEKSNNTQSKKPIKKVENVYYL